MWTSVWWITCLQLDGKPWILWQSTLGAFSSLLPIEKQITWLKVFLSISAPDFQNPVSCFFAILKKKRLWRYNWTNMQGSGIAFNVSYIHSRTMYVVPIERAWKDNSNHELIVMIACKRFPSTYCLMQGRCFICSNFWTFYLKIIITALNK